jgi:threonine dehydrogenase-like Zn-dependent dehydrogenase
MNEILSLGVEEPGRAALFSEPEQPLPVGHFRLDTLFSGLSAGTELTYYRGTNPFLHAAWDRYLCGFHRDRPGQGYPVEVLGYMEVGRVRETRTDRVAVGDCIALAYGHRTSYVANAQERFVSLPPDLDPLLGIYLAQMGPICANGVLHAAADLLGSDVVDLGAGVRGRNVLITGAGVVGLLTALFARHLGAAEVAVVDVTPERLKVATALGFLAVDNSDGCAWELIKARWRRGSRDCGADLAFQCRGQPAALDAALRSLRPQGTVVDLAFYQGGAPELRLGEEFHHNGLAIRCAQIGRVPRGTAHLWDRGRLAAETVELLRACSATIREHLITDIVPLAQGPSLLAEIAARKRHFIQVVFTC